MQRIAIDVPRVSKITFPVCVFFAFGFLTSIIGCGPSLKGTMPVPHVKQKPGVVAPKPDDSSTFLFIDQFTDRRESKALVKGDKSVQPDSDVSPSVVEALKQALSVKGFTFSESAPIIISGEIREWSAAIKGSLPTKVTSEAAIYLEVLDPANKKIYSGVYRGFASLEEASVDEADVSKTLANSLEESVAQVAADKQLVGVLSSF